MGEARRSGDRRLNRRHLMLGAGAGAAAGLFGAGYLLGGREPSRDWERSKDPLKVYLPRDDTANRQQVLLVDQWNMRYADERFGAEIVELSPIADQAYSVVHAKLQSGASGIDVVGLDVPWIAEFAAEEYIRELEGVDRAGFIDQIFAAGVVDGRVYALPFHSDVGMLYYRREFVDEDRLRGLRGWGDLREVVDEVLPGTGFEGGIAMQLDAYEGFTVNVWEYLLAGGVDTAEDGSVDFGADSRAVELLEQRLPEDLYPALMGRSPDSAPRILYDSLYSDERDSLSAFEAGRTPFLRHWPRVFRSFDPCGADFQVGVVPMPGGVLGGQSLAVSAASRRPVVSQALIEFLTGPAAQQLIFERGGYAATRHEPYYDALARIANIGEGRGEEGGEGVRYDLLCDGEAGEEVAGEAPPRLEAGVLHAALEDAGRRPGVERYTQFSRAFHGLLHDALAQGGRPDLDRLGEELRDAVEGR
ncbi:MAG TPA: extracellular solute-binding protein [Glycomyces sp.]|nr:extracellular solute-binding protein [Glycomyces sp.]